MKKYIISRHYAPQGTYGEMSREDGSHVCYTVERSKTGPNPCVPEDTYTASRYDSPTHGPNTWQLDNVPGRTHIQFHVANKPSQLLGCIAPGTKFGQLDGEWSVLGSRIAYDAFMKETQNESKIVFIIKNKEA